MLWTCSRWQMLWTCRAGRRAATNSTTTMGGLSHKLRSVSTYEGAGGWRRESSNAKMTTGMRSRSIARAWPLAKTSSHPPLSRAATRRSRGATHRWRRDACAGVGCVCVCPMSMSHACPSHVASQRRLGTGVSAAPERRDTRVHRTVSPSRAIALSAPRAREASAPPPDVGMPASWACLLRTAQLPISSSEVRRPPCAPLRVRFAQQAGGMSTRGARALESSSPTPP